MTVSETDYERFRRAAAEEDRSIAQLIREAMTLYREVKLDQRRPLRELAVLIGHRPVQPLPTREELYGEAFERTAG